MLKPTNNPRIVELTKSHRDRRINLSDIPVLKDAAGKRMCNWCGVVELLKGNQKYCSQECSIAMFAWANPQKENALYALMIRQEWKCNICQHDYTPVLNESKAYADRRNILVPELGKHEAFWFIKVFKNRCSSKVKPEIDHIHPVSKGGTALGLDNHQAICYTCHKAKTSVDNSGPKTSPQTSTNINNNNKANDILKEFKRFF